MKILIDIGHPAHVHYFKNMAKELQAKNHEILFIAREREHIKELLDALNQEYVLRGKGRDGIIGKLIYLFHGVRKLIVVSNKFKPDIFLGFGSMYAAIAAKLINRPSIIFDDTENAKFGQLFYKPFATSIISPKCFKPYFGRKHIKFDGYMELCYLRENYFKSDKTIYDLLGLKNDEKFVLVRFVSWTSHHDIGHSGISYENKIKVVNEFLRYARVFISSESDLPSEIEEYRIKIPSVRMHDALAFATLFFGESATMASECAILGTPSIYLDNVGRGYTDEEEEKYHLVFNYTESEKDLEVAISKGIEILIESKSKSKWEERKEQLLSDKIDVTAFMVWFIEHYPNSVKIMKENPDYQNSFK
jgi:predicted glycosyltransferase